MLTSSNNSVSGPTVSSSRIPVAKHRQTSPESFTSEHAYQQLPSQSNHMSRIPKYPLSTNSQHDSAVSSGGSGESEGESGLNIYKRRKDSSGSISGVHGSPGGSSSSPSRIPTPISAKTSTPTTIVPISIDDSGSVIPPHTVSSNIHGHYQAPSVSKTESQVVTRLPKNVISNTSQNLEHVSSNRKSSMQRPQSIDIEDEFNHKIRYAQLASSHNATGRADAPSMDSSSTSKAKQQHLQNAPNESLQIKMAPLFSPSKKVLDSNMKQSNISKSQISSPSKIPIANDYFDSSNSKNSNRSNVSPPRKLTPPSHCTPIQQDLHAANELFRPNSELKNSATSPSGSNSNLLLQKDNQYMHKKPDQLSKKESMIGAYHSEIVESNTNNARNGENGDISSRAALNGLKQHHGSKAESGTVNRNSPLAAETVNSKIPLPKSQSSRSRSASNSPSKSNVTSSVSSPASNQSSTRGRSETRELYNESARFSKVSPNSGLPIIGWSLQTEKQELRSGERLQRQMSESAYRKEMILHETSPNDENDISSESESHKLGATFTSSCRKDDEFEYQLFGKEELETQFIDDVEFEEDVSESLSERKKKYEAFMMTGDRMISLAKTPANKDFKSKHPKTAIDSVPLLEDESASLPSSPPPAHDHETQGIARELNNSYDKVAGQHFNESAFAETVNQNGGSNVVKMRAQPQRDRAAVRTSKSEDQLMLLEGYQTSPDIDDCPGSVHTLFYDSSATTTIQQPTALSNKIPASMYSSSTPRKRSPPRRQYSSESTDSSPEKASQKQRLSSYQSHHHPQLNMTYTISPDISTSSLVSASEHYNGGSLINDNVCSPQTSNSSPDTPEWSLIDSFHKGVKNIALSNAKKNIASSQIKDEEIQTDDANHDLKDLDSEDSINSKGNKVIITISNKNGISPVKESIREKCDTPIETKKKHLNNYNEPSRQASWTQLPSNNKPLQQIDSSIAKTIKSPICLVQNEDDDEDIDYPYARPYSPDQEPSDVTNHPYVPAPVFATPLPISSADLVVKGSPTSEAEEPTSLCSEESESDLESIHSYHPPTKVIDIPSAKRLATRLYHLDGFKKTDVSRHLSRNNEYNQVVADEFLKFFDFSGRTLDSSLRLFLCQFCLTGETQERERVLLHFSKRYLESNPEVLITDQNIGAWFRSQDSVHTLTCAIMLLNTDLHGENMMQRKMTCNEFIENLSELNDGNDFPRDLLRNIYYAIKREPIPWAAATEEDLGTLIPAELVPHVSPDVECLNMSPTSQNASNPEHDGQQSTSSSKRQDNNNVPINASNEIALGKTGGGVNPFLSLPDPSSSTDYKKGYVLRKCCVDPSGKKTKLGKRSWKMFFLSLRDMVLYCFKEEKSLRHDNAFCDINNAIRIHHGLAERASDYTKKQFVFRLHTSDQAQYLFQTSDEKELLTWIDAINFVVASLSAPQLPAACSANFGRFQKPLMPSSKSTLNLSEQLVSHERQLMQLRREIEDHLQSPPTKNAKGAQLHNFKEKREFLTFEIKRYETYILTLRTKSVQEDATSARAVNYVTEE